MTEPGGGDNERDRADTDNERNPKNKDKPEAVEKNDADDSVHLSDEEKTTAETPLIESVSEDVSAEVGEFIQQAAQQNEAAAEAVPDIKNQPGPYISFEHVYKSFGEFVVLEDVSFYVLPGETLCILGRSGVAWGEPWCA